MKLIYAKGACSLSVHVLLEELGIPYEKELVSLQDKTRLETYTPKSYVPVLVFENDDVMTEASCILQYLAEKEHRLDLIGGAPGSFAKFRCIEWLDFISTEIHKGVQPLFRKDLSESFRSDLIKETEKRLAFINDGLSGKTFLSGDHLTIADMYAIVNLQTLVYLKFDINKYPNLVHYMHMMEEIPSVKRSIAQEKEERLPEKYNPKAPLTDNDLASMGLS